MNQIKYAGDVYCSVRYQQINVAQSDKEGDISATSATASQQKIDNM